ncbi:hypothetical protein [Aeromonas salmonicida]|uniref:hypothetical protein n=1 Tax=Aeromonas salmonicida TaxID=645 RepID=UPI0022408566|nr:hypothetical protein [Aeromonas salmonicida]
MEIFKASVQYNDFKGSSAADRADDSNASEWLKNNGHIQDGEFLVGISMYIGENHGTHRDPVSVTFLITDAVGFRALGEGSDKYKIRKINVNMNVVDFFSLFKRFEVTLSSNSCLEGKEY